MFSHRATGKEVNVGTAENGPAKDSEGEQSWIMGKANDVDRKELDRSGAANRKTGEDRTNEKAI